MNIFNRIMILIATIRVAYSYFISKDPIYLGLIVLLLISNILLEIQNKLFDK